ncbi:tyrosine-type recombinase/integrase [Chromobacterium haemolyticum]|uniref:tyrosine-type recombinase/integrase n=1 Tax=Chromobacterium haemolyticum TaxID=394935 RepID=UPI001747CB7C|nr:site-specific integrase [Chromobacterium haemolyticum]QOD81852.1 site-specific integrase [Chromobacterium haemolyticum]
MATISKYRKRNGELSYQATVRVKQGGKVVFSATRSFPKESLARDWAKRMEVEAAAPDFIAQHAAGKITVGDLLTRYRDELTESNSLGRSKGYVLELLLRSSIAELKVSVLTAGEVVSHCQARRAGGTGPATVFQDVSALRTVLDYAKRIWSLPVTTAAVDEALPTLRAQTLVSKSRKRDRRPTEDELQRILEWLAVRQSRSNAQIPHVDIVRFAVASCMRLGEIGRLLWVDVDEVRRCILIRERKDPSNKYTNDQWVPLLGEAWEIVQRQPRVGELVFPFNMDSVGAAFERACRALGIEDLRFHDLRHHGVSLLFEQGLGIQEVAMVSGHKSWNNLKRYTQLKPESLHDKIAAAPSPARPAPLVANVAGCLFMGWSSVDEVAVAFDLESDDLADYHLLFAGEFGAAGAVVVFSDGDALWWVYCADARRIWVPEVVVANRLRHRLATGKVGRGDDGSNLYGKQLLEVLTAVD